MAIVKKQKIPAEWSEMTARIINDLFDEILREMQSRYFTQTESKPKDADGTDGELRVDKANSKLYVKVGGSWKETTLN